jgi:hypothetical protein
MPKGIITQTLDWLKHPIYSDANIRDWAGFLTLVLIGSFLWRTVVQQME